MTGVCAAMFGAPDYPGGRNEEHSCAKRGPHLHHECACGARSKAPMAYYEQAFRAMRGFG